MRLCLAEIVSYSSVSNRKLSCVCFASPPYFSSVQKRTFAHALYVGQNYKTLQVGLAYDLMEAIVREGRIYRPALHVCR